MLPGSDSSWDDDMDGMAAVVRQARREKPEGVVCIAAVVIEKTKEKKEIPDELFQGIRQQVRDDARTNSILSATKTYDDTRKWFALHVIATSKDPLAYEEQIQKIPNLQEQFEKRDYKKRLPSEIASEFGDKKAFLKLYYNEINRRLLTAPKPEQKADTPASSPPIPSLTQHMLQRQAQPPLPNPEIEANNIRALPAPNPQPVIPVQKP